MIASMFSGLLAILGMIPGLGSLITTLTSKFFDSKVAIKTAQIGGDVTVATALIRGAVDGENTRVEGLKVISGSWALSFLVVGFASPYIVYVWKILVWDIVLKWGTTDPIRYTLITDWGTTIIACLFGSGTVLAVGHMYLNRDTK